MDLEHQLVGVKQQQILGILQMDLPLISGSRRSDTYSVLADGTFGSYKCNACKKVYVADVLCSTICKPKC